MVRVELGEEETCFALKTVTQLPLSKRELPACVQKLICQLPLMVDQQGRKHCKIQNSALILMLFCIARAVWCGWRRAGGLSKGTSALVISWLYTAVIEAHTQYQRSNSDPSGRIKQTTSLSLPSMIWIAVNKKPRVSGTNQASCGGFFFSFPLCMANSQFQVSKCSF